MHVKRILIFSSLCFSHPFFVHNIVENKNVLNSLRIRYITVYINFHPLVSNFVIFHVPFNFTKKFTLQAIIKL